VDQRARVDPLRTVRHFAGQPRCEADLRDGSRRLNTGRKSPRYQSRQKVNPRFTGVLEADEGTRTLDLLHGKCWRPFAPVRTRSLKPAVCRGFRSGDRPRVRVRADAAVPRPLAAPSPGNVLDSNQRPVHVARLEKEALKGKRGLLPVAPPSPPPASGAAALPQRQERRGSRSGAGG